MTSGEALEILEDRCEEHKTKGQRFLQDDPRRAVYHFLKAADIHDKLAEESQSRQVARAHQSQSDNLRGNAHRLMREIGLISEAEDTPDHSDISGRDEDEEENESGDSQVSSSKFFEEVPDLDLSDVGGMEDLKKKLKEDVQQPLENPEFYRKQGVGIENGVLLQGPPGTGKSYLIKAFAGELGWNYARIDPNEITSKYVGEAANNISDLFEEARGNQPAVVFIDELDALARDRSDGRKTDSERQMVNQLLTEMEQVQDTDILVVGATNKPGDLDEAIVRSERFNEKLHIGPPNPKARKSILEVQLEEDDRAVDWQSMDWQKLVDWSQGFSAADLTKVVKSAVRQSAHESTAQDQLVPVHYRHLLEAMKETEASLKHYKGPREG